MKLNPCERQIYDFIVDYQASNGYPPSISEIADHIGTSRNNTWRYLKLLRARRLIDWKPHTPRTIRIVSHWNNVLYPAR